MAPALRLPLALLIAVTACLASLAFGTAAASAAGECTRVASPSDDDALDDLVRSLRPGETGCLRAGTYGGGSVYFDTPHAALRSYPGEIATITAFMEVRPDAVGAHLHHLRFDASQHSNNTGIKLQADGAIFSDNELTKGGEGVCMLAGSYNPAQGIVIERNRIYDCGDSDTKLMHQIYLANTRGAIVRWNILSGNAGGWGVHMYTDADGTLIEHNIIDGNHGGVIFAGDGGDTSDDNVVRNNAVTFSAPRWGIEASWNDDQEGVGNAAYDNCVYSDGRDAPYGIGYEQGFEAHGNVAVGGSPYVDRAHGDYRFDNETCARLVGDVAAVVAGGVTPGVPEARPAGSPQRRVLTLRSSKRRVTPRQRVRLRGHLSGPKTRRPVVLQVRKHGRWHGFARVRLRADGRFAKRVRIGRVQRKRVSRVRAVVPGVARSQAIRLRIKP